MKAAVIEQPGSLVVKEVPDPACGEYQALCQILYGAVCTGTDLHHVEGVMPFTAPLPTILGHESIGRVIALGHRVRHLAVGDLVTRVGTPPVGPYSVSWGGFAERGTALDFRAMAEDGLPPARWRAGRVNRVVPRDIDAATATMMITWRETLSYALRLGIGRGATVLVIGSGGNGLAFASHAAALGAREVVMVGSGARHDPARRAGCTRCYDYRDGTAIDSVAAAFPDGVDFIIDAVGRSGVADAALRLLRAGGSIGIYGVDDYGRCTLNPQRARGTFTVYNGGYDEGETHEEIVALMRQGKLDASIWIDVRHPYPLARIGEALDDLRARRGVKALIQVS